MPQLVRALAFVKKAAARANAEAGALDGQLAAAIMAACDELIAGKHHEQFVVDVIQGGAGTSMEEDEQRLREARALIQEINLGATAIGTGINAPAGYADLAGRYLAELSGIPVVKSRNLVEATQDTGAFVQLSGVLKRVATKLSKTCNDLRLLSSGPQAGFGDIRLPPRQAGSSIMPGKVNPVIPEVVNQVAFEVIGNDMTVTMASEAGQLQLNAFEPIMGWSLFKSITHLSNACLTLNAHCIAGIEANHDLLARRVRDSITLVTALNPLIGYEKAALIAKTALATGAPIDQVAQSLGILTSEQVDALLVPEKLTQPLRRGN